MSGAAQQALKELDSAAYLSCLFVPEEKREAFAALQAYAAELKRIPLLVSEPLPGEIRLQWWRDVVTYQRAGEAHSHPVASALLVAMAEYSLPSTALTAMVDARIFDLYHDPMPDIAALETYLGETDAALIQLSCLILDPPNAFKTFETSGHAGMAIGIAQVLTQLRRTTLHQRTFIPVEVLSATGCTTELLFAGDSAARSKVITAIVALGRNHLKKFKLLGKSLTQQTRPAFLQIALCEPVFRKVEKLGAKAFETEITLPPLLTPIRLAYRAMRGW